MIFNLFKKKKKSNNIIFHCKLCDFKLPIERKDEDYTYKLSCLECSSDFSIDYKKQKNEENK